MSGGGNKGGVFITPKNAKSQEFVRKTTKYWVHKDDIPEMKRIILEQMPEYNFSSKITNLIQSLYLDNKVHRRYQDRMMLVDKGMLFRYRWYGDEIPAVGFMEQKIRRIGATTEKSVKRRFKLRLDQAQDYIDGKFVPDATNCSLDEASLDLATEIQDWILLETLKPKLRTAYNRTCYQKNFDDPVRISFDENLQFSAINDEKCFFSNPEDLMKRLDPADVYNFPHGVLEIKIRLTGSRSSYLPPWAQNMKDRGIIVPADKFSKFTGGTAILFNHNVNKIPYFLPLIDKFTPAPKSLAVDLPMMMDKPKMHPRIIFQIERTFLGWLRMCQMMCTLGLLVLAMNLRGLTDLGAATLVFGSLFVLIRITYLQYYRNHMAVTGGHDYYDAFTPIFFVFLFITGILIQSFGVSNDTFFDLFVDTSN